MRRLTRTLFVVFLFVIGLSLAGSAAEFVTFETITVADTAVGIGATTLKPDGKPQMNRCLGKNLTAQVNFRFDGTNPTSSVGTPLEANDWISFDNYNDASRVRFIRTTAVSASLRVHCWRQ